MITELMLQQFKAHAATRIPLGRLTVLVGPNAVGKTSVLEALMLLSRLLGPPRPPLQSVLHGKYDLHWLVRSGATEDMKIEVQGATDASTWAFLLTAPNNAAIEKADVDWTDRVRPGDAAHEKALKEVFGEALRKQRSPQPPEGTQALRGAVALKLEGSRLAEPSYSEEERPRLAEDGYGLATVLKTLKVDETERFVEMEEMARQIVPRLRRIKFKRTKLELPPASGSKKQNGATNEYRTIVADELVLDYNDVEGLPAHAASEGTLLALGILCAIFSSSRPNLLLLDDLDRALHTAAQKELLRGIHAALAAAPNLQIVSTTHSPYLVDALQPDEVVLLDRGPNGAVAAKHLSEHPNAESLLKVLTTGELWTAEGESWVAEP